MASGFYLRFPHIARETLTFVADDDVWAAPVNGGRAWRLSSDRAPAGHPRLSPDGTKFAWTSVREGAPEVFLADLESVSAERLTYWGDSRTRTRGWTPDGKVLAISATGQPFASQAWAYALSDGQAEKLPYGPVTDLSVLEDSVALLTASLTRDPAAWKRYRGGTAGRLWLQQAGGDFTRLLAELNGHFAVRCSSAAGSPSSPTTRASATSTPARPTAPTCAGTPTTTPSTPGTPPATAPGSSTSAPATCGSSTTSTADAVPRRLDVTLGGPRAGRRPYQVPAARHLDAPGRRRDRPGQRGRGTRQPVLAHPPRRPGPRRSRHPGRTGPAAGDARHQGPGRVRHGRGGRGRHRDRLPAAGDRRTQPRRLAAGKLGRVRELAAAPDGNGSRVASHDGRLLLVGTGERVTGGGHRADPLRPRPGARPRLLPRRAPG